MIEIVSKCTSLLFSIVIENRLIFHDRIVQNLIKTPKTKRLLDIIFIMLIGDSTFSFTVEKHDLRWSLILLFKLTE